MSQLKKSKIKRLFGVCGGLSEYTGIDVSVVRIGFLVGSVFTGSVVFWLYILLAVVLPDDN